ncbi:CHAT domain-containing protein [Longimicrobium sp.]|uniref:CHAT domain-containing protein n=1 Tax=Longimicrobium sp. TaxID=2029185 RepID=UPI002E305D33|nr:CHAT domain-containing protein [Longimicrobium sp.]HEX6042476.1 CHAT domain-containing protein [Longimicrobium sp.]
MRDPLKVLFLAADPFRNKARLELGEEMRAIDEAIQRGRARDGVELVSHFATRTRDLQYALLRHEPHIVHFAGHGGQAGVIYLGDEHGQPRPVPADALGSLFGILDGEVKAVVLNACHTLPVVEALSQVVDHAIGTNRPITDQSAIEFSAAFYGALAFGRGVRQAFALAVNQLQLDGRGDADVPVLRSRDGAGAADPPLLSAPAAVRGPAAGEPSTDQTVRVRELHAADYEVVAEEHYGSVPAGGRSRNQTVEMDVVRGGKVRVTGTRTGLDQPSQD